MAEVGQDLAHDDWVGQQRDQATGTAAVRADEDADGEDASQESSQPTTAHG